jgi:branched-chain amino acid transport system substrate-binding protein
LTRCVPTLRRWKATSWPASWAKGLRRAGKDPQRKDLVRGLESLRRADLGGFMVDFGPGQREGSRFVDLSLIGSDGRIRQ